MILNLSAVVQTVTEIPLPSGAEFWFFPNIPPLLPMKLRLLPLLLFPLAAAHADTFGSGANTFDINFATIGNAGNADDDTGYGQVINPANKY